MPLGKGFRIAVLPIDNLSGSSAPLRDMRDELIQRLSQHGMELLEETALDAFLTRHRVRYTGGIDTATSASFRTEEQVSAVLLVNLELYNDHTPPKMAFMARLVETTTPPRILWMESFSLTGHEHPGLFEQGMVNDPVTLRYILTDELVGAVAKHLSAAKVRGGKQPFPRTFPPKMSFGRVPAEEETPLVAVLPFFNESVRRYANEILLLHFVHHLHASGRYRPVEPGVIRDKMLSMRIIMNEGISLSQADLISNNLETDFVLTGRVFDYQDSEGPVAPPSVDFSAQMMERRSKRVVWTSKSYNRGDEDVWFYDWRRIYTANRLAGGMVRAVVQQLEAAPATTDKKSDGVK
jgi:hypothetical protein